MEERDHGTAGANSVTVALSLAGIARSKSRGAEVDGIASHVQIGDGNTLDTGKPHSMDAGHWPGEVVFSGAVTHTDGTTTEEIVTIRSDGTTVSTELPKIE
jgi:hypothetical protein